MGRVRRHPSKSLLVLTQNRGFSTLEATVSHFKEPWHSGRQSQPHCEAHGSVVNVSEGGRRRGKNEIVGLIKRVSSSVWIGLPA